MRTCSKCGREFSATERVCPDDGTLLTSSVPTEERPIGKTLDGKYRIDGFIKRGGMGAVYKGTHLLLGKPVAVKLIRPELVTSDDVVERFFLEARAAAKLAHPNIVTVHDLGQTSDGTLYIVMELVEGQSLKEAIRTEGPWAPARALELAKGIASALALAHRNGIIHRDLKPQNIMVTRDSEGHERPKLLDFGIAKLLATDGPQLTSTGMVLGTPHYMSSEQAKGLPADPRSDLYALGVILYEMLVGQVPFDAESIPSILVKHMSEPPRSPRALKGDIPGEVEAIVMRCLEKDPERRFQSAEELMAAIRGEIGATPPPPPLDLPTEAMTAVSQAPAAQGHTMAGAAAAAAPSLPRIPVPPSPVTLSGSGTVRSRDARGEARSSSSLMPLVAVLLVLLLAGAAAGYLLLGRRAAPVAEENAVAASVAPVDVPVPDPAGPVPEPETGGTEPPAPDSAGSGTKSLAPAITTGDDETAEAPPTAPASVPLVPAPTPKSDPRPTSSPPMPAEQEPPLTAPPQAVPEPIPDVGTVSVGCQGLAEACASLRASLSKSLPGQGLRMVSAGRAEMDLDLQAEEIEARSEEQFGTTFVVRTYSIAGDADVPRFDDLVTLSPHTFSFDARFGRDKLNEQLRVIASEIARELGRYWQAKK